MSYDEKTSTRDNHGCKHGKMTAKAMQVYVENKLSWKTVQQAIGGRYLA